MGRRQQNEGTEKRDTSLESAMVGCTLSPLKQRMQAACEEMEILVGVLPIRWDKEPVVSTAIFREGPGRDPLY